MNHNDNYLNQVYVKRTSYVKLKEIADKSAMDIYAKWMARGAPIQEILNGLWEIDREGLQRIQKAVKKNDYEDAGKVVLSTIKGQLMRAAIRTTHEDQG